MPKRGAIAIFLTGVALAFLLSFRTPDMAAGTRPARVAIASPAAVAGVGAPAGGQGGSAANGGISRSVPTATLAPRANTSPAASAAPAARSAPEASAPIAQATPRGAYRDGTYTGTDVGFRFGDVQVQVTISGGRVTDVSALQMPSGDRRTQRITQVVEPILREEALSAQSANLDVISGATYTTEAYAQSLQAALDQAAGG